MTTPSRPLPVAGPRTGLAILRALVRERSLLTPLRMMHQLVGSVFRITLPGFQPAVVVGPEANRRLLVTARDKFSWRVESDPVVRLLRHGLLVTDGAAHDHLRARMEPPLRRGSLAAYLPQMWDYTHQVTREWRTGETRDMLVEMRRITLLILMGCLFRVEIADELARLWQPILKVIAYISPGAWIIFPNLPRPGYQKAIRTLDEYLYRIIRARRAALAHDAALREQSDLLTRLCRTPDLDDANIRDQLLTMLIAGHDTSTALLAWTLYLLSLHPQTLQAVRAQVEQVMGKAPHAPERAGTAPDARTAQAAPGLTAGEPPTMEQLNQLTVLDGVLKESLRLYPPIHIGNRRALEDTDLLDYTIPQDTRVMYSIYLAHRDPAYWERAGEFCPTRFQKGHALPPPLTYVPFGGGPRNCIGAAFSQVTAKAVLAHLVRQFEFEIENGQAVKPHMGATLEPRPGVKLHLRRIRA